MKFSLNETKMNHPFLVYTCIGGSKSYLQVLKFLIFSLMLQPANSGTTSFDFLIICDANLYNHVRDFVNNNVIGQYATKFSCFVFKAETSIHSHVYQDNNMAPSYLKLHLFDWPKVADYRAGLFIDADIIVPPTFDFEDFICQVACETSKMESGKLYAMPENNGMELHKLWYFNLHDYTENELAEFETKQIYPFNTGLFSFIICPDTKETFGNILDMIHKSPDPRIYFYEQSFVNTYCNRTNKAGYDLITQDHCVLFVRPESLMVPKLLHFCGEASQGHSKASFMGEFANKHWPKLAKCVDTAI